MLTLAPASADLKKIKKVKKYWENEMISGMCQQQVDSRGIAFDIEEQ